MTTFIKYSSAILCFGGFYLCSFSAAVSADEVIVNSVDSFEERRLDVEPGESAELSVYLRSAGELLSGIIIVLARTEPPLWERETVSDESGVVKFRSLPPGNYRVRLKRNKELNARVSVGIADLILVHSRGKK